MFLRNNWLIITYRNLQKCLQNLVSNYNPENISVIYKEVLGKNNNIFFKEIDWNLQKEKTFLNYAWNVTIFSPCSCIQSEITGLHFFFFLYQRWKNIKFSIKNTFQAKKKKKKVEIWNTELDTKSPKKRSITEIIYKRSTQCFKRKK